MPSGSFSSSTRQPGALFVPARKPRFIAVSQTPRTTAARGTALPAVNLAHFALGEPEKRSGKQRLAMEKPFPGSDFYREKIDARIPQKATRCQWLNLRENLNFAIRQPSCCSVPLMNFASWLRFHMFPRPPSRISSTYRRSAPPSCIRIHANVRRF